MNDDILERGRRKRKEVVSREELIGRIEDELQPVEIIDSSDKMIYRFKGLSPELFPLIKGDIVALRVEFRNGYTGSVIRHKASYGASNGLFEVAVMKDDDLVYGTPVTDDVLGHLNADQVIHTLNEIAALEDLKQWKL